MRKFLFLLSFFALVLLLSCSEDTINSSDPSTPFNKPSNEVRVFTETEANYVIELATEDTLVFSSSTPKEVVPEIGSIIQLPITENTPYGFLGRVVSVDVGDKIVVICELVSLDEAYPYLSLDVDLTKIDHFYGVFDEDGNRVDYSILDIDDSTSYETNGIGPMYKKSQYTTVSEFDWEKEKLSIPIPESWIKKFTKEKIDISGVIEMSLQGSSFKNDNKGEAKYIDIDIRPHVSIGGKLTGHIKQNKDNKKLWETPKLTFKGAIVVAGIVFPITVPIWMKAELKGDFSTSVELKYNKDWRLHYMFKDGKWSRLNSEDPVVEKENPWYVTEFEASGIFSIGPNFEVNVGVFSRTTGIGVECYPNAYLKAEASLTSENINPFDVNPEAEVGVGMEWRAYCRAKLFGKKVEPFSINLPDITFIKRTLSVFPNVSEFDAVASSLTAELSWRSDSYYLLSLLGVKTGATLFKPDGTEESYYPPYTHIDRLGQRYYSTNVYMLNPGSRYYAAPTISWFNWKWHGNKIPLETEARYHLGFRCINHSYDAIEFDFDLNNRYENVIDYTTEAKDYDGSPMRVHITASYDASSQTLNGIFDFFFYDNPSQQRKDGFSVSLATDDSGYVDCTKVIDNGGCYAALRIYKLSSLTAKRKRYNSPLVEDDCNIGIYNKHYTK